MSLVQHTKLNIHGWLENKQVVYMRIQINWHMKEALDVSRMDENKLPRANIEL
jgi:hypothetical protein